MVDMTISESSCWVDAIGGFETKEREIKKIK